MLAVRKVLGVLISLIALVGVLVTGVLASRRIDQRPRTDDAYLQADLVHLALTRPADIPFPCAETCHVSAKRFETMPQSLCSERKRG